MLLTNNLPIDNLSSYIQQVNAIPMLEEGEEFELARRFHEQTDLAAARRLVMSHLRLVVKISRQYMGYGLSQADLIQEGNIGLMKAVKRFDPEKGVRLVSFALHWIKAEIHEFVLKNWRIVKVATTKAQRKLFFNLRSMKKQLGSMSATDAKEIAEALNVNPSTVNEMEVRMSMQDESYDSVNVDDDYAPSHYLSEENQNPELILSSLSENNFQHKQLSSALKQLDDRSRKIITARWLTENKLTLQELSNELHVSVERVRQLEQQTMKKLKSLMKVSTV